MSLRRVLPLVAVGVVLLAPAPTAARADPLVDAQRSAAVLRLRVADLQQQTDTAVEDYDAAQVDLAEAVTARLSAQEVLDRARGDDAAATAVRTARVRTLYQLGGPLALYSDALQGTSPTDVLQGVALAQQVLDADGRAAAGDARTGAELTRAAQAAATAAQAQVGQARRVEALVRQVQGLLAQQQALLAGADATVVRVAQEQQAEKERQAQAAFAARLAAAQLAAAPTGGAVGPVLPASQRAAVALATARTALGKPYVWGATGPDAFDCSGLTGWAYRAAGVSLPRTSQSQWNAGPHPALADLQPGDLLFWGSNAGDPSTIHHVAIYLGGSLMIAAPHTGTVVQIQSVYDNGYVGATRVS